jgi:hypothetical protein
MNALRFLPLVLLATACGGSSNAPPGSGPKDAGFFDGRVAPPVELPDGAVIGKGNAPIDTQGKFGCGFLCGSCGAVGQTPCAFGDPCQDTSNILATGENGGIVCAPPGPATISVAPPVLPEPPSPFAKVNPSNVVLGSDVCGLCGNHATSPTMPACPSFCYAQTAPFPYAWAEAGDPTINNDMCQESVSPWLSNQQCNTVSAVTGAMNVMTSQTNNGLDGDAAVGLWITVPQTVEGINLIFLSAHVTGTYGLHIADGVNWAHGASANSGGTLTFRVNDVTPGIPGEGSIQGGVMTTVFSSSAFGAGKSQNVNSAAFGADPFEMLPVIPGHTYLVVIWADVMNNDGVVTFGDNGFAWEDESSMNMTVSSIGWEYGWCPDPAFCTQASFMITPPPGQ